MSDFADRPFVAGSLIGLRRFRVCERGHLYGPVYGARFAAGENHAECKGVAPARRQLMLALAHAFGKDLVVEDAEREHQLGGLGCSCGFYAFFDGSQYPSLFAMPWSVEAIIEGYGVCTVGSRGFRASKARLVALIRPRRWLQRVDAIWTITLGLFAAYFMALAGAFALAGDWGNFAVAVIGAALEVWLCRDSRRRWRRAAAKAVPFRLVLANHPDVPVYRSRRAALRAHPLTVPEAT